MQLFSSLSFFFLVSVFILQIKGFGQQTTIKGRVLDKETYETLAFVSIQIDGGSNGCISDIDGKFVITSTIPFTKIKASCVGYQPLEIAPVNTGEELIIYLQKMQYQLAEIVIKPGINPANRIISQVIENRYLNDHERLPSYSYTSYEKMIFTPEFDSLPTMDNLQTDSSFNRIKAILDKQHLFLMESVTKQSFRFPNNFYSKVIANRVSGLSNPLFFMLMSQMQSTTFYKEVITLADKDYINPISTGCFKKYYFELQDTIVEPWPNDTTFILSYRPLLNTNFDGLKGSISISTNKYAIRNVIAIPAHEEGIIAIKVQQLYDFIDSSHWFPVQLNTDLIFKNASIPVDSKHTAKKYLMGRGKSYISDIDLNPKLRRDQFGAIEIDVQPDAHLQPENIWNTYRIDSLTSKENKTYKVLDSIGKAKNLDNYAKKLDALVNGKITWGYIDFYMDNIFKVNRHEGFRGGLKLSTSNKVSTWFSISGYGAYGFKDKRWKYGADGSIVFDPIRGFKLTAGFYDDVDEAGADTKYVQSRNLLNPERFREIMVDKMDHTRCYQINVSSRILKYMTITSGLSTYKRTPLYSYKYKILSTENIMLSTSDFTFSEASLQIRYAFGEKLFKNANSTISLGTKYPIVQFTAIHGFTNTMLGGKYTYNRFDLRITKSFFTKYVGTTTLILDAGIIDRDIPSVNLYNSKASFGDPFLYCPGSFNTMRLNEFSSNTFASLFFSHNFGQLLFRTRRFKPEPELVTNLAIGSLHNPENHIYPDLKSFEKGYFESGMVINGLLRVGLMDLGIAGFYRYGPYALPTVKENIAGKIAFKFVF